MTRTGPDTYVLSTGRTFYANWGVIGLGPDADADRFFGHFSEGADGGVRVEDEFDDRGHWTPAERAEVADFMIALWTRWKAGRPNGSGLV